VLESARYEEATLSDWMKRAPRHLLANNLGLSEEAFTPGRKLKPAVIA
jgi:oxalate decarboxylase